MVLVSDIKLKAKATPILKLYDKNPSVCVSVCQFVHLFVRYM